MRRVRVDIACNDPDSGIFAGVAEQIQIGQELIELEAVHVRAPRFVDLGGTFRLAGKVWPYQSSKEWIGNWCWNAYWLRIETAVEFLVWLQHGGLFHCTMGEDRIFEMWNAPVRLQAEDREYLARVLSDPASAP